MKNETTEAITCLQEQIFNKMSIATSELNDYSSTIQFRDIACAVNDFSMALVNLERYKNGGKK